MLVKNWKKEVHYIFRIENFFLLENTNFSQKFQIETRRFIYLDIQNCPETVINF